MSSQEIHSIIGAGATGSATARLLAELGNTVRVISRSGSGPKHPDIELVATDANNTASDSRSTSTPLTGLRRDPSPKQWVASTPCRRRLSASTRT